MTMKTLEEIKNAILKLSFKEFKDIERWLRVRANQIENEEEDKYQVAEAAAAYEVIPDKRMTIDEFLEWEAQQPQRYEHVGGYAYPASGIRGMAGASLQHNRISGNLFMALRAHLRGKPCEVFNTDFQLRVHTQDEDFTYYPDLMVACNRADIHKDHLVNPTLIVEILSPSTSRRDRNEKRANYQQIPALEEYVLVAQSQLEVTIYRRKDDWQPIAFDSLESIAQFRSIGLSLPLAQIYEGVLPENL